MVFKVSPNSNDSMILRFCVTQGLAGARRSVIGDSSQLLTHYYDDARTMYEVFRRGFSISGENLGAKMRRGGGPGDAEAQMVQGAQRVREAQRVWLKVWEPRKAQEAQMVGERPKVQRSAVGVRANGHLGDQGNQRVEANRVETK